MICSNARVLLQHSCGTQRSNYETPVNTQITSIVNKNSSQNETAKPSITRKSGIIKRSVVNTYKD